MKFDKENWREVDINIDSLWLIGPRAKGGKRENNYHGNFVPQIPDHLIRRYTEEGDVVLEPFMGSGTTLFESERLRRDYIGFDINQSIIDYVEKKMSGDVRINYAVHNCDVTNPLEFGLRIKSTLQMYGRNRVDFILAHPPYWDIIRFTEQVKDLSNTQTLDEFISRFVLAMKTSVSYLRAGRHFAIVIGDVYRDGEVVPLGFYLMNAIRREIRCKLKGIVVKDIVGNRGKLRTEALWRYRTLRSDTFLFKHEYIFVFKKC